MTLGEASHLGPLSTTNFNPVAAEFANMIEYLSLSDEDKPALVSNLVSKDTVQ